MKCESLGLACSFVPTRPEQQTDFRRSTLKWVGWWEVLCFRLSSLDFGPPTLPWAMTHGGGGTGPCQLLGTP